MNMVLLMNCIGNQLLCHDDELEGRRIAYILYLVPEDWNQEDGGNYCILIATTIFIDNEWEYNRKQKFFCEIESNSFWPIR
jgi:Rps23 Pro-64 3,4-dihydroxylase Tpa1-like proline 4-hydroxylase